MKKFVALSIPGTRKSGSVIHIAYTENVHDTRSDIELDNHSNNKVGITLDNLTVQRVSYYT